MISFIGYCYQGSGMVVGNCQQLAMEKITTLILHVQMVAVHAAKEANLLQSCGLIVVNWVKMLTIAGSS